MKLNLDRVIFSTELDEYNAFRINQSIKPILERYNTNNNYFFVDLDLSFGLNILTYDPDEVQWLARKLECTDREAVYSIYYYDGFLEDYKDILYENNINDYKRYTVMTISNLNNGEELDYGDYIGESIEDATDYFNNIVAVPDIIKIIEHDEEEEE